MRGLHICGTRGPRCPACRSRRTTAVGDHGFCEVCGAQFNAHPMRRRRTPVRERVALSPAGLSILSKKHRSGPRRPTILKSIIRRTSK